MPRSIWLVAIGILGICLSAGASAQADRCNRQVIAEYVSVGRFPDLTGCTINVASEVRRHLGDRFQVKTSRVSTANAEPGTIIRQGQDGPLVLLYVAVRP